jgi:hypothetical protein
MATCFVCAGPFEGGVSFAARVFSPGPGLVQVCSKPCAEAPKFSLRGHPIAGAERVDEHRAALAILSPPRRRSARSKQ